MSLKIPEAMVTVKGIVNTNEVRVVGASLFVAGHCTDEEISEINSELHPQSVEKIDLERTRIDL
jgi:hypothetical protein